MVATTDAEILPDDRGQHFEKLGFMFCRIGTIALIAMWPAYALLLAAGLSIYYYVRALQAGVTRSDCLLRHPVLIIAVWIIVAAADLAYLALPHFRGRF